MSRGKKRIRPVQEKAELSHAKKRIRALTQAHTMVYEPTVDDLVRLGEDIAQELESVARG